MNRILKSFLMACLVVIPSYASAIVYNVDITYDGASQSLDPGSDAVNGLMLNAGDGFLLDLHTQGNDFWEVIDSGAWNTIYAAFLVNPSDTRTYNSVATFFNNGLVVHVDTDLGAIQQFVHVGAQQTGPASGLEFDQIVVDYTYVAGLNSTFGGDLLTFSFLGNNRLAEYRVAVPEPTTLLLLGLGLAGLGFAKKRLH